MITPRQEAEASQRAASDPGVSAFVAASAGSGKTRLLTDRLLRLMVGGARPERILCLTFTKAAAAEMSIRLRARLGRWVTMPDAELAGKLRDLGCDPDAEMLRRARSLFAHVLDLPGGMRIGTIHAFCQSLLRRFPLEAGLSPHFQLAQDRDADDTMLQAREMLLSSLRDESKGLTPLERALRTLAGTVNLAQFGELVAKLKGRTRVWRQPGGEAALALARRRILGVTVADRAAVIAAAVDWPEADPLRAAAREMAERGTPVIQRRAAAMLDWLGQTKDVRAREWQAWRRLFFTVAGKPNASSTLANKPLAGVLPLLLAEQDRIAAVEDDACAADVAKMSEALCELAAPLLEHYENRKQAAGLLEFDDLIASGTRLLVDPGAAWVLYKLDGGLDHLLLDEVQDTAPEQWRLAHSLTQEFFAGDGARDGARTVFAVGDRKQSIFSFQGADVAGFDAAREALGRRVTGAGQIWRQQPLQVSFRSTTPVLALVDAVFADPAAAEGVTDEGEILTHRADRADQAGCVELWGLTDAPPAEASAAWTAPDRNRTATSAVQRLAEKVADWIAENTSGGTRLESKNRLLRPGDIMILVRQRTALPAPLVRALKVRGVPVAGLDRMTLTAQPAVQDLMTLGDALLLPQDDLTFACLLTSPLGGLDDDALMALAAGRGARPLWEVLRERHEESPAWSRAWMFFNTLLARADYVSPHALFAEALGAMRGRARLLARLGHEAAEPIDELLNAALNYAKLHPPSLQGFLQWLRRSGTEITRQPDAAGDEVRILTVHGAKGLQAPVVILPDTTGVPKINEPLMWARDPDSSPEEAGDVPIWAPLASFHCDVTRRIRDQDGRARREESNRLLYVALTRAEDRLIVCGAKPKGALDDACWYSLAVRGFRRLTEISEAGSAVFATPQIARHDSERGAAAAGEDTAAPAYLGTPPPPEPARPRPLAPSRPEGVELGPPPASASPLARSEDGGGRFRRGQLIHGLLQHLPVLPRAEWHAAAVRFLSRPAHGLTPDAAAETAAEAVSILNHPTLAPLFGPGSRAEVPLTGVVGDAVIGGLVDRLVVLPDRVLVGDFKTNRRTPATVEATPVAYLRQMASYRAVLRGIFPDRAVRCALIWTREARVSVLPDALLDGHEPGRSNPGAGA